MKRPDKPTKLQERVARIKRDLAAGRLVIDAYKLADALLAKEPSLA
ncbi:MAG: flagellar biosynthesis anti-sigma factor FlgM [Myxococcales bacterium]|nr:flagellar biosynthesis anti-sigma factor FlgM [Myxococcales bacterium]